MKIQNIIWDFDGTLFDTYSAITKAFQQTLLDNYEVDKNAAYIYDLCKIDTKHCASVLAKETSIDAQDILNDARHNYDRISNAEQRPFPHVRDVCEKVRTQGGTNFIVTHRDRKSLMKHLEQHNFDSLFTEIITRDDPFPEKPSSASFSHLLERHRLSKHHTIGIGDRDIDILAANRAGINAVFFCNNAKTSVNAKLNISHFSQLLKYV